MITVEFSGKEMAYLLLSLKRYEAALLAPEQESIEDAVTDLAFIQSLSKKLKDAGEAR